ncbi:MAG: hypothetical protein ACYDAA_13180 [Syntrophales bacterium]
MFGRVNGERKTDGKKKAGVHWISWLFGLAILVGKAMDRMKES